MDVERRNRKLETTPSLLVDYINRYNVGIDDHHLRLLSLRREEALLRYRINDDGGDNRDVGAD